MLRGMLSLSLYRLDKRLGYALGIGAAPEEMQLSKSRMHEGIVARAEAMSRGSCL